MKKHDPNCAAPHGLPHGRTPSRISLVHSKACMPTNVAPNRAVASNNTTVLRRSFRYPKFTAKASVPLLLIRMNVMIAIRSRGTLLPKSVSENTSLGLGQGTVVEPRTVIYEIRKLPKMKVSLTRNIHIIGLPHGTFLNARWSDEKSATRL